MLKFIKEEILNIRFSELESESELESGSESGPELEPELNYCKIS